MAFGNLEATEEEIEKAARIAQILRGSHGFPEGMSNSDRREGDHPIRRSETKSCDCKVHPDEPADLYYG